MLREIADLLPPPLPKGPIKISRTEVIQESFKEQLAALQREYAQEKLRCRLLAGVSVVVASPAIDDVVHQLRVVLRPSPRVYRARHHPSVPSPQWQADALRRATKMYGPQA